ncbi:Hypothetical predicted protein [Paramuricea clavata]|uniref:Uncharacterized protein n=1 Tax=Paramuricea clavata TaxID=317549 RepID=A0A6S7IWU5_PARCT|nr:Hypothetical predicted protein [Paramuricea clavata]
MSKSAQKKKEQREKIREQFLRDLFTEDNLEHGFSIFEEEEPKTKRYKSEAKIQMGGHKAINVVEPKKHSSEVKIQMSKPKVTKVGPKRFRSEVKIQLKKPKPARPIRKAPDIPKGASPWKPTPKPRIAPPKVRPNTVTKEETSELIRKPVKQSKEVEDQAQVITPEEHEIDPFGSDLQKPVIDYSRDYSQWCSLTYMITPQYLDPLEQMTASRQVVRSILDNELKRMGGLKYTETLKVRMSKEVGDGKTKKDSVYFKSKTGTATNFEDIENTAANNQLTILSRIETFQNLGSNWRILNIKSHYVNIAM